MFEVSGCMFEVSGCMFEVSFENTVASSTTCSRDKLTFWIKGGMSLVVMHEDAI